MKNPTKKRNSKITMDTLARMVQEGFLGIEKNINGLKSGQEEMKNELKNEFRNGLKTAKNELKADLNKKVDVFTHKELEYRVEKVEEKVGIGRKK